METEKSIRHCYVTAVGVKNRCRKQDRHTFELGNHPVDTTAESLEGWAREVLASEMKSVSKATLYLDYATVSTSGGFSSMVCELLDPRSIKHPLV